MRILLGLVLLAASFLAHPFDRGVAQAQQIVLPCVPSGNSCIPVSAANPLPTTGGGSFPPAGCSATNGVVINNATPCSLNFTSDGSGNTLTAGTLTYGAGPAIISSPSAADFQHGAADVNGAPVAQTLSFQNALAGSATNQASANTTIIGSLGTGTGTNGDIIFQTGVKTTTGTAQATPTTVLTLKGEPSALGGGIFIPAGYPIHWLNAGRISSNSDGVFTFGNNAFSSNFTISSTTNTVATFGGAIVATNATLSSIASDATHTDTTVCQDTTSHLLLAGSGTAGICLGNVSSIRFKDAWMPLNDGLAVVMALNPGTWRYKPGIADGGERLQVGFLAEDYARVLPDWTRYDAQDRPNGVDLLAVLPQVVRAIQQLKADNDNLRAEIDGLKRK